MSSSDAKRLRELETENTKLKKKAVAVARVHRLPRELRAIVITIASPRRTGERAQTEAIHVRRSQRRTRDGARVRTDATNERSAEAKRRPLRMLRR
jgi:hypothetical protein